MDGISPNLQNVSPYETCPPTVLKVSWSLKALHIRETALRITALRVMVGKVKSSSQISRYQRVNQY